MSREEWQHLNVQPGDRVRHNRHGVGIVGGSLYAGARVRQVRLIRSPGRSAGGPGRSPIEVGAGSLEVLEPAPVFEVGQETRMGPVLERHEREDAPGYVYVVKTGNMPDGEPRTTTVGPEWLASITED